MSEKVTRKSFPTWCHWMIRSAVDIIPIDEQSGRGMNQDWCFTLLWWL